MTALDEAEAGESDSYRDLATRCINEAARSDGVIVYVEPGETLMGALLECGAALASGRPVVLVGKAERFSRVFAQHPLWHFAPTLEEGVRVLSAAKSGCPNEASYSF